MHLPLVDSVPRVMKQARLSFGPPRNPSGFSASAASGGKLNGLRRVLIPCRPSPTHANAPLLQMGLDLAPRGVKACVHLTLPVRPRLPRLQPESPSPGSKRLTAGKTCPPSRNGSTPPRRPRSLKRFSKISVGCAHVSSIIREGGTHATARRSCFPSESAGHGRSNASSVLLQVVGRTRDRRRVLEKDREISE